MILAPMNLSLKTKVILSNFFWTFKIYGKDLNRVKTIARAKTKIVNKGIKAKVGDNFIVINIDITAIIGLGNIIWKNATISLWALLLSFPIRVTKEATPKSLTWSTVKDSRFLISNFLFFFVKLVAKRATKWLAIIPVAVPTISIITIFILVE